MWVAPGRSGPVQVWDCFRPNRYWGLPGNWPGQTLILRQWRSPGHPILTTAAGIPSVQGIATILFRALMRIEAHERFDLAKAGRATSGTIWLYPTWYSKALTTFSKAG
jgi:hypothetical protein